MALSHNGYLPGSHKTDSEMEVWNMSQLLGPIWEWWEGSFMGHTISPEPSSPRRAGSKVGSSSLEGATFSLWRIGFPQMLQNPLQWSQRCHPLS